MKCSECGQEVKERVKTRYTEIELDGEYNVYTIRADNCRIKILGKYNYIEVYEK